MKTELSQTVLPFIQISEDKANGRVNKLDPHDRAFHDWYRFVLSYPPHLVRKYLNEFHLDDQQIVLDPFCGTGTTIVEAKLNQVRAIGIEANPFAQFASSVKIDWGVDSNGLVKNAHEVADATRKKLARQGIDDSKSFAGKLSELALKELDLESAKLLLADSISPLPLHKTLVLLDCIQNCQAKNFQRHALLALAKVAVFSISNLRFGPEIGIGKPKADVPVVEAWLSEVERIASDLQQVAGKSFPVCQVHLGDARSIPSILPVNSVDAVITSPPYPNEKDYTRTTRLESVLLGFITSKAELQALKRNLVRSNTRGVYKTDDDDRWVADHPEIERIVTSIEKRRVELKKTSGFERMYGRVTKLYFGGMARHLAELRGVLRPGARLAYVVGDQASYLRVMIRTGELLADIAQSLGYEVERMDLFRTRFATATKAELREEVLILRWKG